MAIAQPATNAPIMWPIPKFEWSAGPGSCRRACTPVKQNRSVWIILPRSKTVTAKLSQKCYVKSNYYIKHLPADWHLHGWNSTESTQVTLGHILRHLGTRYMTPLSLDMFKPWSQTHTDHSPQVFSTSPAEWRNSVSMTQRLTSFPTKSLKITVHALQKLVFR